MTDRYRQITETVLTISGQDPRQCMACGKCTASCPAYEHMNYHPHQFVSLVKKGKSHMLLDDTSIYHCLSCYACAERCPRGVEPVKLIEAIRLLALREKGANRLTPDAVSQLLDDEMPQQVLVSAFRKYSK